MSNQTEGYINIIQNTHPRPETALCLGCNKRQSIYRDGLCFQCFNLGALFQKPPCPDCAEKDKRIVELEAERDLAVAHDRQPYPTQWAYDQACKAIEKHRSRAESAEAERDAAVAACKKALEEVWLHEPCYYSACRAVVEAAEKRERKNEHG